MWLKRIIFGLFFLLFSSALIFHAIGKKTWPLTGDFSLPGRPIFTYEKFWDGKHQEDYAEYNRTHNPVYSELIRMHNQFRFTFFNTMPAGGGVIGKEQYFFEKGRLKVFYGVDYMSEYDWNYYMNLFDFVADTMQKLNKPMFYMHVGDKARILEEYIPEEEVLPKSDSATYNLYNRKLKGDKRIDYIDLAAYFLNIKDTCKIELYPKYSMHWSIYSVYLAMDSLVNAVNARLPQYEAAQPVLDGFDISKKRIDLEYEMLDFLNMYWSFNKIENHYPLVHFIKKTKKKKPRVLIIGDSFGQFFPDRGYLFQAFDDSSVFLRYNAEYKKVYNVNNMASIHQDYNYWDEFNKADAVIFVSSEVNLPNFGFGFFEMAYDHFKGIDNFIESYHTRNVIRTIENGQYLFTIPKGVGAGTFFKNRNPNMRKGKKYKLTYMEKGKGEMTLDVYPDPMPEIMHYYDTDTWKQYTWEFAMPDGDIPNVVLFRMFLDTKEKVENELQFKGFKLEEVK